MNLNSFNFFLDHNGYREWLDKSEFTMDDVIQQVVNWNPRWLEEQKKNFKSPPVYGENKKINRKTNVFSDYKEYCKTFYPLCILELWASVFKDFEQVYFIIFIYFLILQTGEKFNHTSYSVLNQPP